MFHFTLNLIIHLNMQMRSYKLENGTVPLQRFCWVHTTIS